MPRIREAAVTGLGMLTPGGTRPEDTWAALCRGRGLARHLPYLAGLPVDFGCTVPALDAQAELGRPLARRSDRFTHLAIAAARRAVGDAGLAPDSWDPDRVAVVLGVGSNSLTTYDREFGLLDQDRPTFVSPMALPRSLPNMVAAEVAIDLGVRGPVFSVSSACASGATALGIARDLVSSGTCDIALAGGSESALSRMAVTCFAQMRALSRRAGDPAGACRPFDTRRDGLVLAEAAAVLVLERPDHAARRSARVRALLRGFGSTADAHHPVAPHPEGSGARRAVLAALADAVLTPSDIDHVNAHGTATPAGDAAEAQALLQVFDGDPPPVTASKSVLGHSMGAAAAVEAAVTVLTLEHQLIPPTANLIGQDPGRELDVVHSSPRPHPMATGLSSSFGFGGHNAVLVFTTP